MELNGRLSFFARQAKLYEAPTKTMSSNIVIQVKGRAQKTPKHPQFGIIRPRKRAIMDQRVNIACKTVVQRAASKSRVPRNNVSESLNSIKIMLTAMNGKAQVGKT
jgi:hypothetical protein